MLQVGSISATATYYKKSRRGQEGRQAGVSFASGLVRIQGAAAASATGCKSATDGIARSAPLAWLTRFFLFYILKKLKFQKYMSVSKNFKNIPWSPYGEATDPKCNFFFFKFATRSLAGGAREQGGLSPPPGDRPYISSLPPFPPHLSQKISPKIQKKREG